MTKLSRYLKLHTFHIRTRVTTQQQETKSNTVNIPTNESSNQTVTKTTNLDTTYDTTPAASTNDTSEPAVDESNIQSTLNINEDVETNIPLTVT